MRRFAGYLLLVVSTIAWCILPVMPFLDLSGERLASISFGVFVFAEVTWLACIPLLGKEIFEKLKAVNVFLKDKLKSLKEE